MIAQEWLGICLLVVTAGGLGWAIGYILGFRKGVNLPHELEKEVQKSIPNRAAESSNVQVVKEGHIPYPDSPSEEELAYDEAWRKKILEGK